MYYRVRAKFPCLLSSLPPLSLPPPHFVHSLSLFFSAPSLRHLHPSLTIIPTPFSPFPPFSLLSRILDSSLCPLFPHSFAFTPYHSLPSLTPSQGGALLDGTSGPWFHLMVPFIRHSRVCWCVSVRDVRVCWYVSVRDVRV